jgi:hypothetical protein
LYQALERHEHERDTLRANCDTLLQRLHAAEEYERTLTTQLEESREQCELIEFQLLEMSASKNASGVDTTDDDSEVFIYAIVAL